MLLMSSLLRARDSWVIFATSTMSIEPPMGLVPKPVMGARGP
jgi:hypothetical protein